jgi:hypothetical protein
MAATHSQLMLLQYFLYLLKFEKSAATFYADIMFINRYFGKLLRRVVLLLLIFNFWMIPVSALPTRYLG